MSSFRKSDKKAVLHLEGKTHEMPILEGSMGPSVLDTRSLYTKTGLFAYDPGFTSTASCRSTITYIDGEAGILLYRGYPIDVLAENSTYAEVAYLLLYGELPDTSQLKTFSSQITYHTMVHEQFVHFFRGFRRDAHPMAVMVGAIGALSSFYNRAINFDTEEDRRLASVRLIAKIATVAAMAYKYSIGQPFVYPRNELRYVDNFLRMCFEVPSEPYISNPVITRAMRKIMILHMDHEQNASTSTVRLAASSGANPFACMAAGIASLWGPAHGGANEGALRMLMQIGDKKNIPEFIERAKNKDDPFRLMGFGHRVYKNYDPRAKVMHQACHEVLDELHMKNDPLLSIAMELERIALQDPYFIERKLYPNIDFYSGITLRAMGFPTSMFTVLFALARTSGWVAQWNELMKDPEQKIGRPRQLFTGAKERQFKPIEAR